MAEFTDLFFGMADAKNEASDFPDEFVRTFVDHQGVIEAIRARSKFLLLGPKGTGKTAAAWYLELTARDNAMLVATRDVSELPLAEVSNLKTASPAARVAL